MYIILESINFYFKFENTLIFKYHKNIPHKNIDSSASNLHPSKGQTEFPKHTQLQNLHTNQPNILLTNK